MIPYSYHYYYDLLFIKELYIKNETLVITLFGIYNFRNIYCSKHYGENHINKNKNKKKARKAKKYDVVAVLMQLKAK